jgi:hypothetical protein
MFNVESKGSGHNLVENTKLNQTDSAVDKLRLRQANEIDNNYIDEHPGDFKNTVQAQHIEVKGTNIEVKNNNTYNILPNRQDSLKHSEHVEIKLEDFESTPELTPEPAVQKEFTDRDYIEMSVEESIQLDKRGFRLYYWKRLSKTHIFLVAFYYKTLWKPQHIRIIAFFLSISYYFALNAIFYSDNFISARQTYNGKEVNFY